MTQPEEKTFTQVEVDAIVRDRLKRERDATATKYADYDELKSRAAEADKTKSDLEKVLEKVTTLESRATKAEVANLRNDVISGKKVPAHLAKYISGATKQELEAKAEEVLADWKSNGGSATEAEGAETTPPARETAAPPRSRPTESLRSGAPMTGGQPEETNPLKLAELVPRI